MKAPTLPELKRMLKVWRFWAVLWGKADQTCSLPKDAAEVVRLLEWLIAQDTPAKRGKKGKP